MKQQSKLLLSLMHGAGLVAVSSGMMVSTEALAGISNTRHNLGATSGTQNRTTNGTSEICVFCHTPHAADTSASAPLWNKALPPAANYTTYTQAGSSTYDGASFSGTALTGSVSLACLSCHDGTQGMDNLINAPGSGGYTATGADANYGWSGTTVTAAGVLNTAPTNLSQDLRNDHPVGVAYCGGSTGGTYTAGTVAMCRDKDFKNLTQVGATTNFFIETNVAGKDKSDLVLYTRVFPNGNNTWPSVECGSCHDPHVEAKASNQTAFMRISQAQSAVCLACHDK